MYYTLSNNEKEEFISNAYTKESYTLKGHSFTPLKGVGKQYCKGCGLVSLRNKATQWCAEKGCNYSDHKQYASAMKRLSPKLK